MTSQILFGILLKTMKGDVTVNLKYLRRQAKKTQMEVAERTGVSQSTYSTWETGRFVPNSKFLPALAAALHCTIDDLFEKGDINDSETR